jgi:hypothetical protein
MTRTTWLLRLSLLIGVTALAACSSSGGQNLGLQTAKALVSSLGKKKAPPSIEQLRAALTPEVLASIDGRVITAVRESTNGATVLGEEGSNGGTVTYIDSTRVGLMLQDGIVVGTRNIGNDLLIADVSQTRARLRSGGSATRVHRVLDGVNTVELRSYTCAITRSGQTVTENCAGTTGSFTNTYLLNGAGQVRASRQWLGPQNGYFRIEQIK